MYKIYIIGISAPVLPQSARELLAGCRHIFATPRMHEMVSGLDCSLHNITPLSESIAAMKSLLAESNIGILASGDPLFFGIGKRLISEFGPENLSFHPALSAIQKASALFKTPWDDAVILSLHGRNCDHIPGLILQHSKTILFTDSNNSPDIICRKLSEYLHLIEDEETEHGIVVQVAENIGIDSERCVKGSLQDIVAEHFAALNVLLIENHGKKSAGERFGLNEEEISHSRGLITKSEVRAATIHQLRLPTKGVLWDIGAGSGSVSIEAARINPDLTVYAIEHKIEEIANIKENIRRFGCYNIVPVFGKAPECLDALPVPDRIFVGGSSGTLPAISEIAANRLSPDGLIVINGVIEKTIQEAPPLLARNGFTVETSRISVVRTDSTENETTFNPITITTGRR